MATVPILLTKQFHQAKKAGDHTDWRVVIGDKAYSWATKKLEPEAGGKLILWEKPVHDAQYALTKHLVIPDGQYGAGVTKLIYAQKGEGEIKQDSYHLHLNNGDEYAIHRVPKYGEKAWLLVKLGEVQKVPQRHTYKEIRAVEDLLHVPDLYASKKYDGAAFWIGFDSKGSPRLISRRLSVTGAPIDRTAQLPHITEVTIPELANHTFYSEIIHTGHRKDSMDNHAKSSGILNSKLEKSLEEQRQHGPLRVVLTDVHSPKIHTYGEKLALLRHAAKLWNKPDHVFLPEAAEGVEGAKALTRLTKARGDEGVILTSLSLPEEQNPRYKIKHVQTYNLRVIGMTQELDKHGNPKDSMGALIMADATGRHVATPGTGFTKEQRAEMWKNKDKMIGSIGQVKAMAPTGSGKQLLRAPVYNGEGDGEIDILPLNT